MIQIGAAIVLFCFAIYVSWSIPRLADIFSELQQPRTVQWLVWLYPLPFALPILDRVFGHFFFPFPFAVAFLVPGIISARQLGEIFERSAQPKRKAAVEELSHIVTLGFMGIMCACIITAAAWIRHADKG